MKFRLSSIMILIVSILMLLMPLVAPGAAKKTKPRIDRVAEVNGAVITRAEFDREMDRIIQRFNAAGHKLTATQMDEVKKNVLDNLIARELLYQESKRKGITVDKAEVEKQISELRKKFPSEQAFTDTLKKMHLTRESLKTQVEEGLAIQKLVDREFVKKTVISDAEAKKYYDEHPNLFKQPEKIRARHILIKVSQNATKEEKEKARKKIEDIRKKLKKGEDFSKLAREYSEGPSGKNGGDLGYFTKGQMVQPFEQAAFSLKPGQVSDIVETRYGYHLIKLVDRKPATTVAFKDVKDQLEEYLKQEKVQKEVQQHVEALRKQASIKTYLKTKKK